MEETQVTSDLTPSQVLARDVQELSQIVEVAIAPLTQMTPVELSQNVAVREKAQEAVSLLSKMLGHMSSMLATADALTKITKTVHFQKNGCSPRIQAYKNGVAVVGENGTVTADAILDCDFLFIGDLDATYNPSQVTVCENVHIVLGSDNLRVPTRLTFWSGGTYHLYHGYSLAMCINLDRTDTLNLK